MLFHLAFFRGYNGKHYSIHDAIVGYLGAACIFVLFYTSRGTIEFPKEVSTSAGFVLFFTGILIHFKAQLDFHRYKKEMFLVTKGIYKRFRHPMYLGFSIALIGGVFAARTFIGLATLWIWILLISICAYLEEVKLRWELPPGKYDEYAKKTWF